MREDLKRENRFFRRRLFVIAIGFFSFVMLVTSIFGKKGYMDLARTRKAYGALQTESRQLQEVIMRLEQEIGDLETNPKAVEKEAREKLWLMKPDEMVIVVKGREILSLSSPQHAPTDQGR